ncbi:MAG: helix-hairpin-helix domain-containing protein [Saprospiraceae bacterium]|nr:helix-hairpin-helix domain-containing protein [Candidatus Vicinibacter proximus]MCC6844208.1 helix-hairpin-helix domain-containing protein [Saprospiraceae bacterium]
MGNLQTENLYLSQKERLGLGLLILTLFIFILVPYLWRSKLTPISLSDLPKETDVKSHPQSIEKKLKESSTEKQIFPDPKTKNKITTQMFQLFYFDPNHLNTKESIQLGIPPRAYSNLQKYLKAGGKIKKAEDLQKIYGIDAELLNKLRPYVKSSEETKLTELKELSDTSLSAPAKIIEPFEINSATEEEWKSLPGIGEKLSARIIKYKTALGGFLDKSQVCEVYGISDSLCLVISNYLQCTPQLSKIKVNSADMDELEMHPYLNRKQSEFIINYRRQHRTIKNLDELKSTGFFKKEELAKIEPYLAFD